MSDQLHDERTFTSWAEPGWTAWNSYSPELEFCQFVGLLHRMASPSVTVETGAGAGRVTDQLSASGAYLGFESDPEWRKPGYGETPTPEDIASADFVILDSDPVYRLAEIDMWAAHGKPGSVCAIHDAGNGHADFYAHVQIRAAIDATGIKGIYLNNPRGSWIGQHP